LNLYTLNQTLATAICTGEHVMSQGLVMAGLAAAALYLLSPDLRRSVNGFLEQLATEERRKSQLLEAERRAAIISDVF